MKTALVFLLVCLVSAAPGAVIADWQGEEVVENGERIVRNPETVPDNLTIELEELWRRGEEDDDVFFGMPIQILEDTDGNVFVLDSQVSEIIVFSPDGEYVFFARDEEG